MPLDFALLGRRILDEALAYVERVSYEEAAAGGKPANLHYYMALGLDMLRQEGTSPKEVEAGDTAEYQRCRPTPAAADAADRRQEEFSDRA